MIVGCYAADFYCQNSPTAAETVDGEGTCSSYTPGITGPHQFTGNTRTEAYAEARAYGWRIDVKTERAWCPVCAATMKKKSK